MPVRPRPPLALLKPLADAPKDKQALVWYAQSRRYALVSWVPSARDWLEIVGNAANEQPAGWLDVLPGDPT